YMTADTRTRLCLLDTGTGSVEQLTTDTTRADSAPTFSPDSRQIAYVSNPIAGPDKVGRDDIHLIDAKAGSTSRMLMSTASPNKQKLEWSPDGKLLSFLRGADQLKLGAYSSDRLGVIDVQSGKGRMLTEQLDRAVVFPKFAADGQSILFAVEVVGYHYTTHVKLDGVDI